MTSERMAMMMGDPPFRAAAYADDVARVDAELTAQQERVKGDQNWRTEWRDRVRGELVQARPAAKAAAPKPAPPTVEQQVMALWNAETPIGVIAEMSGLSLGRVYEIVSAA